MTPVLRSSLPALLAPFEGGFYGGTVRVGDALFAIAWAPKADGESTGAWGNKGAAVPGADSCCDSLTNTLAMAEAGSTLAKWALDLRINGHDDWCLPARDVLELAYRHAKPSSWATECTFRDGDNPSSVPPGYPYLTTSPVVQTPAATFQKGNAEAFDEAWYWSSTQYSERDAWGQIFDGGNQISYDKSYEGRARAVRLIQLTP